MQPSTLAAPLSAARRFLPRLDGLESRLLLSASSSYAAYESAIAHHAFDRYVADLRRVELFSQTTPAQYTALRDDARALSAAISTAPVDLPRAQTAGVAVTLLIDRSLVQGWLDDGGWSAIRSRMALDLGGLAVPSTLIDQTVADMKAAAVAAGVDLGTYQVLVSDQSAYAAARAQTYGSSTGDHFPDPQVYYTQHLRGFFRGWAVQKSTAEATLRGDVAAASGHGGVVNRDVSLLLALGVPLPSDSVRQLTDAYAAAFAGGVPDAAAQAAFRATAIAALGVTATASRTAQVDRLAADMPAFFAAAGSPVTVQTIAEDVAAVLADGSGSTLNPFLVSVLVGPRGRSGV